MRMLTFASSSMAPVSISKRRPRGEDLEFGDSGFQAQSHHRRGALCSGQK